ncbi:response regulator [Candidatus Cyanaurora vandensis]|uniref:response regulator n=1 Tax=Candidatus Cyanaurora vandensis TaxID=2714958 RepID=UPI00257E1797|nr:response regulator [Candidatus Cyanaurora vandensis]
MATRKIMVLDSSDMGRRFYALALRSQGYEVVVGSELRDLDQALTLHTPLVLLLDMKLPGLSPYSLCGQLQTSFPALSVLLLVERDTPLAAVEQRWAISRGAADLLLKNPAQVEAVLVRVNQLIRGISSVDRQTLRSALQGLQPTLAPRPLLPSPVHGPVLIPSPAAPLASRSRFLNGLQNAWLAIQTKAPEVPTPLPIEPVVRYRGTIIHRPEISLPVELEAQLDI